MTLILAMSKPEGVYMSADYRVTQWPSGKLVDDASVKFLTIAYPPLHTGPKALLGFSGLAILPKDKTPMGTWLRETLRGESEVIDASMMHLGERLNRDVRPHPFQVTALVIEENDRRFFGGFSNLREPAKEFGYTMLELTEPWAFAHGSGMTKALGDREITELVSAQLDVKPRSPEDHMGLLASINRRVAAKDSSVSPYCHVSFIEAGGDRAARSSVFTKPGEPGLPFEMPFLLGFFLVSVTRCRGL